MPDLAEIAVVGGSGFYEFLEDAEEVKIDTPFGPPSDPVSVGEVAGKRVAFLSRPCRGRNATRLPATSPTAIGSLGGPNGVSILTSSASSRNS
jgi:purine nucleoside phosphorylase